MVWNNCPAGRVTDSNNSVVGPARDSWSLPIDPWGYPICCQWNRISSPRNGSSPTCNVITIRLSQTTMCGIIIRTTRITCENCSLTSTTCLNSGGRQRPDQHLPPRCPGEPRLDKSRIFSLKSITKFAFLLVFDLLFPEKACHWQLSSALQTAGSK